jgi:hypothetical protein
MSEGSYSISMNPTAVESDVTNANEYVLSEQTFSEVGFIDRNGTELITPYLTSADGYISRVILTNTGASDVNYTATVISDDGNSANAAPGAAGTIKAGTNLQIDTVDSGKGRPYLVDGFSTKPRGAALFTFVGANRDIQGVYQTVDTSTGDVQSIIMQRRGGGDGGQ